ncbi:MAG: TonB-dependent receptor [Alteromonas sp.]|nr:TonB-dependent receptor [Alteromonas sp.]MAK70420.1 TonB-dependent receptor [Idiomarinaceae bacterium]|tara:strand:- start:1506 stop:4313 length:2808 start_codon:yes stop_codon:yes gene_type:complete
MYSRKIKIMDQKLSLISLSLLTALGTASAAESAFEDEKSVERIQVTGSSIKRTDIEGALPLTTISAEDIANFGVTSVSELIQKIPAMQGYQVGAQSVGGGDSSGNNGKQTVSLRDLGGSYTLVLLNGRRMASADSGGTVDISSIPLAAIKRVDILKDGASALYGSDAIAGVVNFIMKDDVEGVTVSARADKPQEAGGESSEFSITGGFGNLGTDGFNILMTYYHFENENIRSLDREFGKTGIVPFNYNGEDLFLVRASSNAIPANLYLNFDKEIDGSTSKSYNPYAEINGECAQFNYASGDTCIYDFTENLEISPESKSDNLYLQGSVYLNDNAELYASGSYSNYSITTRIAANTLNNYKFELDSPFVTNLVQPLLTAEQYNALSDVRIRWRTRPAGSRSNEYDTDTFNFTSGIRGDYGDLSYDLAFTKANSSRDRNMVSGYLITDQLTALLDSGAIDVFARPDQLPESTNEALRAIAYSGNWDTLKTKTSAIEGRASAPAFELPAGMVYVGGGFDYRDNEFISITSQANKDSILTGTPDAEYDLSRETYGVYLEAVAPIIDGLEVTAAARYDNIGAVYDGKRAANAEKVNNDASDTTYKLSFAYRPNEDLLLRGSIGTGFKAASMIDIAGPKVDAGVTSQSYDCPLSEPHPLAQYCFPQLQQYNVATSGNNELQPETSKQRSAGFVYAPSNEFSVSVDWWQINLTNQVKRVTQRQIFADPVTYNSLYGTLLNELSGELEIQVLQAPVNIGKSNNQGIDWAVSIGHDFSMGYLSSTLRGTYIFESETLRVGTVDIYDTSLGKFGPNSTVTFPHKMQWANNFSHGDFAHSVNLNYQSGYEDQSYSANASQIRYQSDISQGFDQSVERNVSSYLTVDYLTKWQINDSAQVGFGIKNLLDRQPPLSLRTSGGGYQVGYDPRYVDQLGRTFYVRGEYNF